MKDVVNVRGDVGTRSGDGDEGDDDDEDEMRESWRFRSVSLDGLGGEEEEDNVDDEGGGVGGSNTGKLRGGEREVAIGLLVESVLNEMAESSRETAGEATVGRDDEILALVRDDDCERCLTMTFFLATMIGFVDKDEDGEDEEEGDFEEEVFGISTDEVDELDPDRRRDPEGGGGSGGGASVEVEGGEDDFEIPTDFFLGAGQGETRSDSPFLLTI